MKSHYATISTEQPREARRQVHVVWCPKYRKRVLTGQVATRVRDLLRQIAAENELQIISGKVAADHVHMFISYRAHQNISQIVQWLKGTSSRVLLQEFPHRGGGVPGKRWLSCRCAEWARRLGASPPMRMTASWSGRYGPTEYKVVAR